MSKPPPDLALVGQSLEGRWRIDALLGAGGMGAVYRGVHVHLDQRVAIKVLRPHLAGDAVAARRFAREARGTFKLDTEHAVKVNDFGVTESGLLYMVMEHLDGRTVNDELGVDGAFAPARAVRIAVQICHALAAAHRLNFIHRDLKPDNVMLIRRGADPDFVKVLDFGLAKLIEGAGGAPFSVAALTQKDMVFGTPEYMAPEQAMGQPLDGRADVYALGATLFEMLTGRPPFFDASPMQLLAQHVRNAPPSLREARPGLVVPDALEAVVRRCLAKKPDARPASAEALAAELIALLPTLASSAPRVPAALASSPTIDVDALAVAAQLDAATQPMPPEVRRPPITSSPTDLVSTRGLRRGTRVTIAAVLIATVGLGALVVVALTRPRPSRSASVSAPQVHEGSPPPVIDAGAAAAHLPAVAPDAAVAAAIPIDAGTMSDARTARDRPRERPDAAPVDPELARHLAAAEAARRSGNRLRQLAEADAALALDSKGSRARFLMGEALLETGDAANGCKYLRLAKRLREARALLDSGRCPPD